jgi:hypothetical protein
MHRDRKEKGTAGEWEDGEFMLNKDTIWFGKMTELQEMYGVDSHRAM